MTGLFFRSLPAISRCHDESGASANVEYPHALTALAVSMADVRGLGTGLEMAQSLYQWSLYH